jgi:hypothetical protein
MPCYDGAESTVAPWQLALAAGAALNLRAGRSASALHGAPAPALLQLPQQPEPGSLAACAAGSPETDAVAHCRRGRPEPALLPHKSCMCMMHLAWRANRAEHGLRVRICNKYNRCMQLLHSTVTPPCRIRPSSS